MPKQCRQRPYAATRGDEPRNSLGGAGDGTRTRDALLGRQVLYQLSYSRMGRIAPGTEHDTTCRPPRQGDQPERV